MTASAGRTERRGARAAALAAALGLIHAASFSPPLASGWLQLAALAGLFLLLRHVPGAHGRAACVLAFGVAWFGSGVGWLYTSMHVYGGMPAVLAGAAVLLFSLYLSLFPLAAVAAARWWTNRRGPAPGAAGARTGIGRRDLAAALALAACWGASEMLRGWLLTGFPWLSIGYAHVDGPLAGFAPWLGVYGVGTLAALLAALLALLPDALRRPAAPSPAAPSPAAPPPAAPPPAAPPPAASPAAASPAAAAQAADTAPAAARHSAATGPSLAWGRAAAVLAAAAVLPAAGALLAMHEPTRPAGEPVRVRLAQGNVPQQMKFDPQRALDAMLDYTAMVEASDAQLVVLPETAWTVPWPRTPESIGQRLLEHTRRTGAAIAIGMPLQEDAPVPADRARYTNSVALLAGGAARTRYDKRHLVPFGEFIPAGFAWFVQLMNIPLGEFGRGAPDQAPFEVAGQRFAFNICYEDLFGEELIGAIRDGGATVLVNVSNIAWFGDSRALPQHLAIARMRTLETGRPMLRATNTGVTASIDHRGRVLAQLPHYRRDVLDTSVQGTTGLTAYVRAGNLLPAGLIAVLLLCARAAALGERRRRR